ncbi:MAG TPA: hypothetical protein VGM47_10205 [Gammaproteobacteria bacterium]
MSSKTAIVIGNEIRKSLYIDGSARAVRRDKLDFKVKKYQGTKSQFSTATLCADPGVVFVSGTQE